MKKCTIQREYELEFSYTKDNGDDIHISKITNDIYNINNIVKETKNNIIEKDGKVNIDIFKSDCIICENVYQDLENKARCKIGNDYCDEFKNYFMNRPVNI